METSPTPITQMEQKESIELDSVSVEKEDISNIDTSEITHTETPPSKDKKKEKSAVQTKSKKSEPVKSTASSQDKKPIRVASKKKPKIQFEELVWNFGEITEGDIIEKKFKFTNVGNAPLEIIATSATCGCTRPSFPFLDIAPGESNVIGVTYNSVGKDGEQDPEVTVESNTHPKITTIKLHGTVKPKPKKEAKSDSSTMVKDSIVSNQ